ncbi:MAG TPA: hypothetical protein VHU23_06440 [Rhizomicrobium sp.]|jgi:hypothetical protein|nr:hypothetical protein [Rhizomicrobium sp.]
MRHKLLLAVSAAALVAFAGISSAASLEQPKKSNLYSNLFATYSASQDGTSVSFSVCGSVQEAEGCFGGGSFGPFGHACAVIEGKPKTKGDVVTRDVYVLDKGAQSDSTAVLDVYKRTDTITSSSDTIQVSLTKAVSLGLPGGPSTECSMGAGKDYVFAATTASTQVAAINMSTLAVSLEGGFSPPATVTSITADDRGYVSVQFTEGFYVFGPDGSGLEDGGGNAALVNTRNGWLIP